MKTGFLMENAVILPKIFAFYYTALLLKRPAGASKFCGQSCHAIILLFVKKDIIMGGDIGFHEASNLFYLFT